MSADVELSDTGVWIDTQTGDLVNDPPAEGVQIVPKGGELTPAVKATIERHQADVAAVVVEGEQTDPPVEGKAPKRRTRAKG